MLVVKVLLFFAVFNTFCTAIDEKCSTNEDCTNYNLARCVDGVCKCEKGKRIKNWISTPGNSNRADCELVFNSECFINDDCKDLQGSVCENKKCICKESYFPDVTDRQCITASKPHGQCKLVHECTPVMGLFAECKENICVCKYNYYLGQDNKCAKVKAIEESCQTNEECFYEKDGKNVLRCEQNKCMCADGYVQENNQCTSGANYNVLISTTTMLLMLSGILLIQN